MESGCWTEKEEGRRRRRRRRRRRVPVALGVLEKYQGDELNSCCVAVCGFWVHSLLRVTFIISFMTMTIRSVEDYNTQHYIASLAFL
jgi:hypothetical protein